MEERRDQVFTEVKVVVVHARRHDEAAGPTAGIMQILRMLAADESVLHAVHDERGRLDLLYSLNILKAVLDEVLKETSRLILRHSSDRLER